MSAVPAIQLDAAQLPPRRCTGCLVDMPPDSTGRCTTCERLDHYFGCGAGVHFFFPDLRTRPVSSDRQFHGDHYHG